MLVRHPHQRSGNDWRCLRRPGLDPVGPELPDLRYGLPIEGKLIAWLPGIPDAHHRMGIRNLPARFLKQTAWRQLQTGPLNYAQALLADDPTGRGSGTD